jgi:hypothetical protein
MNFIFSVILSTFSRLVIFDDLADLAAGLPEGIFQTKNPNLGKFWRDLQCCTAIKYNVSAICYILWPFGKLVVIWYIFPRFGIMYREKSGNPA